MLLSLSWTVYVSEAGLSDQFSTDSVGISNSWNIHGLELHVSAGCLCDQLYTDSVGMKTASNVHGLSLYVLFTFMHSI